MLFKVAITETRRRVVIVEAESQSEAHRRIADAWRNGEVTLADNDFDGFEVYVIGETDENEGLFFVEGKN